MADTTEGKQAELQTQTERQPRRTREMSVLTMIGNAVSGSLTLNNVLDQALETTLAALEMEAGEIFLLDATRGEVSKVRHRGLDPEAFAECSCFTLGEGIPGRVVQTGECIIIPNLAADHRFVRREVVTAGFHTFAAVPLKAKGRVIGCLDIAGRRPYTLTEADLELLTAVGAAVGLAVANGRLYEDLWIATKQLEAKIEELRRTQTTLIETERLRAMGQLAAGVAHDFNNALSTLLGQAQLMRLGLQQDTFSKDQLLEHLKQQERAALDAAETVRRIREATRQRGMEPFTTVAMNETVMDVVEITRSRWKNEPQARGVMITLFTDLDAVPPVSGREAELREALTNLLFNAVDALPHGGTITITTRATRGAKGEMVELTVSDTGIGMPEAVRARLFEPFFTTKGAKGTGLGLSMVHGIVKRHGGTIDVTSTPGEGTAVTVRLPAASEEPASPAPSPATVSPLSCPLRLRVLIIDDVPSIAETLALILCAMGHETEAVAGGEEGLARIETGGFDLVITDLSMPGMSGWEVASLVKARWPGLPVILITGWGEVVEGEQLATSGVDLILAKPFTNEQLLQAIAKAWAFSEERRPSSV
ncbi:ATP-binding protein [Candidatus Methylomirabilis sp.]|uniref:ATP-binding protein n=1 Tax=Candidatus Methylomirabilis sp. TaxID=2032687 RepID=UPI003C71D5E8